MEGTTIGERGDSARPEARQQHTCSHNEAKHQSQSDIEADISSLASSSRSLSTIDDGEEMLTSAWNGLLEPPAYSAQASHIQPSLQIDADTSQDRYGTFSNAEEPTNLDRPQRPNESSLLIVRTGGEHYYLYRRRRHKAGILSSCCKLSGCPIFILGLVLLIVMLCFGLVAHMIASSPLSDGLIPHRDRLLPFPLPADSIIPWPSCASKEAAHHKRYYSASSRIIPSWTIREGCLSDIGCSAMRGHHITGKVHIMKDSQLESGMAIEILIGSTEEQLAAAVTFNKSHGAWQIDISKFREYQHPANKPTCTMINVLLRVADDAEGYLMSDLSIEVEHLSLELASNWNLQIENRIALQSTAGDVACGSNVVTTSRELIGKSISGSIMGSWPLHENLHLQTTSGPIKIVYCLGIPSKDESYVNLKEHSSTLSLSSISGNVDASPRFANEPVTEGDVRNWPQRRYSTTLKTVSGAIRGHFPLGNILSLKTTSGLIQASVLPVFFPQQQSGVTSNTRDLPYLHSATSTGNTVIQFNSPNTSRGEHEYFQAVLNNTIAVHSTTSGSISLAYPQSWMGTLKAQSISGTQSILGDGLRITQNRQGPVFRFIKAVKDGENGEPGGSKVDLDTVSGATSFVLRG